VETKAIFPSNNTKRISHNISNVIFPVCCDGSFIWPLAASSQHISVSSERASKGLIQQDVHRLWYFLFYRSLSGTLFAMVIRLFFSPPSTQTQKKSRQALFLGAL
jgi:hypothetical protein